MSAHGSLGGSSQYASAASGYQGGDPQQQPVEARRLDLSLNESDGSLQTTPLLTVLLATTDALYADLYNMAQGELDVVTTASSAALAEGDNAADNNNEDNNNDQQDNIATQRKKERMSNLSFAQRRHELALRLAANSKRLQQTAALTAATAATHLARDVRISSTALQHTRQAWVQADEAQDALYFFHAQLFPARRSPHDVYGALDVQASQPRARWYDLPNDLRLQVDPYETSPASTWGRLETDQRWQLAVRDKLVTGEVGYLVRIRNSAKQQKQQQPPCLWKISLKGGIVKLMHGTPKVVVDSSSNTNNNDGDTTTEPRQQQQPQRHPQPPPQQQQLQYPIEALLTVLPPSSSTESTPSTSPEINSNTTETTTTHQWTLLSVAVHVHAKTGEFHHQLETSNRQRYDLHRLAASAMSLEENNHARTTATASETLTNDKGNDDATTPYSAPPARPLQALFHTVHTFQLAWQLELLSAQAQALRRGVWATAAAGDDSVLTVTPVQFADHANSKSNAAHARLAVHFWKVDDSYGPPAMGELRFFPENDGDGPAATEAEAVQKTDTSAPIAKTNTQERNQQLTLAIRAVPNQGILVSLSGASGLMKNLSIKHHDENADDDVRRRNEQLRSTVRDLLEAASNPFALSASDALLAATKLCAELKCQAVVRALNQRGSDLDSAGEGSSSSSVLPHWISVKVHRGSIAVAARIRYHGIDDDDDADDDHANTRSRPILFQIMCDARTGSFVNTFSRSMHLLRLLSSGTDYAAQASEPMALRIANLPPNRRGRGAHNQSTNRVVRDAFASLSRSMNLLGQRVGVGGDWDNVDDQSSRLRDRAIRTACGDVRAALVQCCGMAVLYGLAPLALGAAVGQEAIPDMAGEAILSLEGMTLLPAPPISVLVDQDVVETAQSTSDGMNKQSSFIDQALFSLSCSISTNGPILLPLDVNVKLDNPMATPERTHIALRRFTLPTTHSDICSNGGSGMNGDANGRPAKRQKADMNGESYGAKSVSSSKMEDVMVEATRLAELLSIAVGSKSDE